MYTLHDILDAYHVAPTPLLQAAVERWLAQIVLLNRDGYAADDPALVQQASDIVARGVYATIDAMMAQE